MKRSLAMMLGLLLVAVAAHAATWQPAVTGDRKMDGILGKLDTEAKADPDGYADRLGTMFGFSSQDIRQTRDVHGLDPAGMYMCAALAHASRRPVLDVAEEYKRNPGRGWGVMAQEMGIKPGSAAFHELKRNGQGCLDHMRADRKARQKHEKQMKKEQERHNRDEARGKGRGRPR